MEELPQQALLQASSWSLAVTGKNNPEANRIMTAVRSNLSRRECIPESRRKRSGKGSIAILNEADSSEFAYPIITIPKHENRLARRLPCRCSSCATDTSIPNIGAGQ